MAHSVDALVTSSTAQAPGSIGANVPGPIRVQVMKNVRNWPGEVMSAFLLHSCETSTRIILLGPPGQGRETFARAFGALYGQSLSPRAPEVRRRRRRQHDSPSWPVRLVHPGGVWELWWFATESDTVRELIGQAGRVAGAILVVRADCDSWAIVREQVNVAHLTGVRDVMVLINIVGQVSQSVIEDAESQLRRILHEAGYPGDEAIIDACDVWSALCSDGKDDRSCRPLDELFEGFARFPGDAPALEDRPFQMKIGSYSSLKRDQHAVATGVIEAGRIRPGRRVELLGIGSRPVESVVQGLRRFHRSVNQAGPGETLSVILHGDLVGRLRKGMLLAHPGTVPLARRFEAVVHDNNVNYYQRVPVQISFGKHTLDASFQPADGSANWRGAQCLHAVFELEDGLSVPAQVGNHFMLSGPDLSPRLGVVTAVVAE